MEDLHSALLATFTASSLEVRQAAEDFLKKAGLEPGYTPALLGIATNPQTSLGVAQSAAVNMKNAIARLDWNADRSCIPEQDRAAVKEQIIPLIATSHPRIRKLLLEATRYIISYDFPAKWGNLPSIINQYLEDSDPSKSIAALEILRKLSKRYESYEKGSPRRAEVDEMSSTYFPILLRVFQVLNSQGEAQTESVAYAQKLLLKIFYSVNNVGLAPVLMRDRALLDGWFNCIHQVLSAPVDPSIADTPDCSPWLSKKWVGFIVRLILVKYASSTVKKEMKEFAQYFLSTHAPKFIQPGIALVMARVQGSIPVPDKVVSRVLNYFDCVLESQPLYAAVHPQLDEFLQKGVLPMLNISDKDIDLFENNPQEYLRKNYTGESIVEDFTNPTLTAVQVIRVACEAKSSFQDKELFVRMMQYCDKVLGETNYDTIEGVKTRYGVLMCLGGIRKHICKGAMKDLVEENLLVRHVFPALSHSLGYVRSLGIWCISRFVNMITWKKPENFAVALHANLNLLRDSLMVVRVEAAMTLKFLVAHKLAGPLVEPILGELIQTCFTLMNEVDSEDLVQTLEVIIGRYGENLMEHAMGIFNHVAQHFMKTAPLGNEEPDMEAVCTSTGCINALVTLVAAIPSKKTNQDITISRSAVVREMQLAAIPILLPVLTPAGSEFFSEALQLVNVLLMFGKGVQPQFWQVYQALFRLFKEYASDFFRELLPVLDNFISNDPEGFLRGTPENNMLFVEMMYEMCKDNLTHSTMRADEKVTSALLMEVMLQHCKDHHALLDPVVPKFYDLVMNALMDPKANRKLKVLLCNVILNGLWYNAPLTLEYLESKGATKPFMDGWMELVPTIKNVRLKKVVCLAVTALLELANSGACLPQYFSAEVMGKLLSLNLKYVLELKEEYEKEDDDDEEGEEDEDDDDLSLDDDDSLGGMNDEQLEELCNKARMMGPDGNMEAVFNANDIFGGVAEDDDDEQGVWSVVDLVSEAEYLRTNLLALQQKNPQVYCQMTSAMDQQQLGKLEEAAKFGVTMVSELAKDRAEE